MFSNGVRDTADGHLPFGCQLGGEVYHSNGQQWDDSVDDFLLAFVPHLPNSEGAWSRFSRQSDSSHAMVLHCIWDSVVIAGDIALGQCPIPIQYQAWPL